MIAWLVIALLVIASLVRVVRLVALDGHGTNPPPRSHLAELGTQADRELAR